MTTDSETSSRVGIIAGSGALPFAAADEIQKRGQKPYLFAIRGFCDPAKVLDYPHHWIALGQAGRLTKLMQAEGCRTIVLIGGLTRPGLSDIRLDWGTLRLIPAIAKALRGGDDHLLSSIGRIFEQQGFDLVGIKDIAPGLLMPEGSITRATPDAEMFADIARGGEVLRAMGPFDVGQAVVVVDGHVIGVEGIEGTDSLLARMKQLRDDKKLRSTFGRGVLVKMPKAGQDLRFDLPAMGPKTIEGVIAAGLGGVAVVAGRTLLAEPQATIAAADRAGIFVTGLPA